MKAELGMRNAEVARVLYGVLVLKPLRNLPVGTTSTRLRMRADDFVELVCSTPDGIRRFLVTDVGTHWVPNFECERAPHSAFRTPQSAATQLVKASNSVSRASSPQNERAGFLGHGEARREAVLKAGQTA